MGQAPGMVPVVVSDSNGLYVSDSLMCANGHEGDVQGYAATFGIGGQEELIRFAVRGLMPSDTVERAGYPTASGGLITYRIVRGDAVLGRVRFIGISDVRGYAGPRWSCKRAVKRG